MDEGLDEMKKEDLVRFIKEGIRFEGAVPIFCQHFSQIITQITLDEVHVQKLKQSLERLSEESKLHKKALEDLFSEIQKEDRDVY